MTKTEVSRISITSVSQNHFEIFRRSNCFTDHHINIHIRKHLNTKNHLKSFQCTFDTLEGFKSTRTTDIIALAAILPRGKRGYLLWIVVKELKCKEKRLNLVLTVFFGKVKLRK